MTKPETVDTSAGKTFLVDHRTTLPADILSAWFDGKYVIGDKRNNQIKNLGICLSLLGTYRYFTIEEITGGAFRLAHYGLCRIELIEHELEFHGIRIYTNPKVWGHDKVRDGIPLWKSAFSKIWDDGIHQNLLFAYSLKMLPSSNAFSAAMTLAGVTELLDKLIAIGESDIASDELGSKVELLKSMEFKTKCMDQAEPKLATPQWDEAWTNNNNPAEDGDLFAFLRFKGVGEAMLAGNLCGEYRCLAPTKLSGFNCLYPIR